MGEVKKYFAVCVMSVFDTYLCITIHESSIQLFNLKFKPSYYLFVLIMIFWNKTQKLQHFCKPPKCEDPIGYTVNLYG